MTFARSLLTVSGFTMLSRIAGFVRDTLTAIFLGAGLQADAFFVAQRLPNLFRSLFAEGAFSAAFVPLYAAEKERHGPEAAQHFAGQALALLVTILAPLTILAIWGMHWVIQIIAPGFSNDPEKFALAVRYSCITFPYLFFISITALQTGVLNAHGRFAPGASAPILLNLIMIAALYFTTLFGWEVGETLAWAMAISGVAQAAWLAFSCRKAGVTIPLLRPHLSEACRTLFRNITPGAVGAGATQINLMISTLLASLLPTGAVSYLYYADRLNQLPLGIIGVAVATTLLPILSKQETNGDLAAVRHTTSRAIEYSLILGLPAAIGLGMLAQPIIQTLFEHGAFTAEDTRQTAAALTAYALCVPAFLLAKVFSARFFARQDTKTPVRIAMLCMIANVALSLLLLGLLKHVGMALATSLATWLNVALLLRHLKKREHYITDEALRRRLPRLALSLLGMAALTYVLKVESASWFTQDALAPKIMALFAIIALSSLGYAVLLFVTQAVSVRDVLTRIRKPANPQGPANDA